MSDFHERLRAKKEELKAKEAPTSTTSDREMREIDLRDKVDRAMDKLRNILVGASLVIGLIGFFVIQDWWGFVGSPEYAAWKTRVERNGN